MRDAFTSTGRKDAVQTEDKILASCCKIRDWHTGKYPSKLVPEWRIVREWFRVSLREVAERWFLKPAYAKKAKPVPRLTRSHQNVVGLGQRALREIRYYEMNAKLLIRKLPFARLVSPRAIMGAFTISCPE